MEFGFCWCRNTTIGPQGSESATVMHQCLDTSVVGLHEFCRKRATYILRDARNIGQTDNSSAKRWDLRPSSRMDLTSADCPNDTCSSGRLPNGPSCKWWFSLAESSFESENDPLLLLDSTEINTFVSDKIKENIWNSEYADLTFLQNVHVQNYFDNSVQLTLTNNQLMLKSQSQIYIQRHPCRASEQFLGGLLNRTPLAVVTSAISSSVSVWLMTLQGHGQILTSFMDNLRLLDQYPQKQDAENLKTGFENEFPLGCLGPRAHFECNNF
ncbi:hypothetical protein MAR_032500 [Mya arenaria]|uniref:Uncharacterized protein n=1 Tax=Mya arenaria TaxID=6604 RepID=A0ABY7FF78_MYAAR|nr:hypothetical protein MAR_032500 [Mya arenaria]